MTTNQRRREKRQNKRRRERGKSRRRRRKRRSRRKKRRSKSKIRKGRRRGKKRSCQNGICPQVERRERSRERWTIKKMRRHLRSALAIRAGGGRSHAHPLPVGGQFGAVTRPELGQNALSLPRGTPEGRRDFWRLRIQDQVDRTIDGRSEWGRLYAVDRKNQGLMLQAKRPLL